MARNKASAAAAEGSDVIDPAKNPTSIDPAAQYHVALSKPIQVGSIMIKPGHNTHLRGDVLKAQIDMDATVVTGYELVA